MASELPGQDCLRAALPHDKFVFPDGGIVAQEIELKIDLGLRNDFGQPFRSPDEFRKQAAADIAPPLRMEPFSLWGVEFRCCRNHISYGPWCHRGTSVSAFEAAIGRPVFAKGVVVLKHSAQPAQSRAEALFARKEAQRREGEKAMAEYEARQIAIRTRTERLRALRTAHENPVPAATAPARSSRGKTAAARG